MAPILQFKHYSMGFKDDDGQVHNLLRDVSFVVEPGHAVGIVGESGCGKSMTSLSAMRLLPEAAVVQGGEIELDGVSVLEASESDMASLRGDKITMIFQEPMTALNPVLTIGSQIAEAVQLHYPDRSETEVKQQVIETLERVGISNAEQRYKQYPHEFSGGMRQRVMIAMAIINHPALLIADEPTTALDVTVQAQILELMRELKGSGGLLLITHNMGVVAELCEEVIVMYAGCTMERGTLKAVFDEPMHPYTKGLMRSIPTIRSDKAPLPTIPGTVPTVYDFEPGCRFADRCPHATERCHKEVPPEKQVGEDHLVQCWLPFEGEVIVNG